MLKGTDIEIDLIGKFSLDQSQSVTISLHPMVV